MWSVVIFMILVLAAMMAGCRDLLSSKVLKSNDHPKQDVNKKFYIPPMVIVVGLLCFYHVCVGRCCNGVVSNFC